MDNAQKAIMIGVGLFITIIIIAAVMLITGIGQNLTQSGTEQINNMATSLQNQLTSQFDNVDMMGSAVLTAIQRYYSDDNMVILVNNTSNQFDKFTILNAGTYTPKSNKFENKDSYINLPDGMEATTAAGRPSLSTFSNASNKTNRIVTTAKYKVRLVKINDGVCGIAFNKY